METRFTVLGEVRAHRDDTEVDTGTGRTRLVIALLLARANEIVTRDSLLALLWDGDPPDSAVNVVHQQIGLIRRIIDPGLPPRAAGDRLIGTPGGYRMRADAGTADVLEFRELVARARDAAADGRPGDAVPGLVTALSLWSGPFGGEPGRHPEFTAVDRERAAAACDLADAALRSGVTDGVLPLVRAVADGDPLDESLAARVVRLLDAAGRTAEARAHLALTVGRLRDELGVDPGPELAAAAPEPVRAVRRPAELPPDLRWFTGREVELAALTGAADRGAGVIAVDGLPGAGKSTLAVHWAHSVADRFPDGQLFAQLRGFDPAGPERPDDVLLHFLQALGVAEPDVPAGTDARGALLRTLTAGRRLLVVLDDARDVAQVRPLLPAGDGCLTLVTARARLTGLAVSGAELLALGLPSAADARTELRDRLGGGTDAELDTIVAYCGRLPLALSVVAARAAGRTGGLGEVIRELHDTYGTLDAFDGDDPLSDVRTALSWSYRQLGPDAARLFRLLPAFPGPDVTLPVLASLAGSPRRDTARLARELTRTGLLTERAAGRFAPHDLIRVYAAELAAAHDPETERDDAFERVLVHYGATLRTASARNLAIRFAPEYAPPRPDVTPEEFADAPAAAAWFAAELPGLQAALRHAYARGANPWQVAAHAMPFFQWTGRMREWEATARESLAASVAAGDDLAAGHLHRLLASALHQSGDEHGAALHLSAALDLFVRLGLPKEQAGVHLNLGHVHGELTADWDGVASARHYGQAAELYARAGNRVPQAMSTAGVAGSLIRQGRIDEGIAAFARVETILGEPPRGYQNAFVFYQLGRGFAGHPDRVRDSIDCLLLAVRFDEETGNELSFYIGIIQLAEAYLAAGRTMEARGALERATAASRAMENDGAIRNYRDRLTALADALGARTGTGDDTRR
ncbi:MULTISPECIES: AfsR/SARP family transcriptional regulator [Catenuloplanes]|uniref:DNA-binding SARP family transcriptional activator/tetratricopeptide (TPR) repeat protein n=1 Tax=Catenuloplanes niger TaxID=587534 RepID=A0AAE4CQP0_9ACTN|nr:BTAD domain-containing putative transcriptional regulator [Catenuloplanes niger]MDR7320712.1 DNA-binding SARP family transcriptional activator/tetratricopeptide (TPR) repeat protein [Catenuloplanes niger]